MEQWEYLPTYVAANAKKKEIRQYLKQNIPEIKNPPPYMVESVMLELNRLGEQGWELVHMEPVAKVGRRGDVLIDGSYQWSNVYFCVFKRRINLPEVRPVDEEGRPAFRQQSQEPDPMPIAPRPPLQNRQQVPQSNTEETRET